MKLSYSELCSYETFEDRFEYLRLNGFVGHETFGFNRYLNQRFYTSPEWRRLRNQIILRDEGCDLAIPDRPISGRVIIHHLNPVSLNDIEENSYNIWNPENLICVSKLTHDAIHYSGYDLLPQDPIERFPNDMCPWK